MQHLKSGTSTMGFFLLKPTELSPKRTQRVLDGDSRFGCEVPKILTLYDWWDPSSVKIGKTQKEGTKREWALLDHCWNTMEEKARISKPMSFCGVSHFHLPFLPSVARCFHIPTLSPDHIHSVRVAHPKDRHRALMDHKLDRVPVGPRAHLLADPAHRWKRHHARDARFGTEMDRFGVVFPAISVDLRLEPKHPTCWPWNRFRIVLGFLRYCRSLEKGMNVTKCTKWHPAWRTKEQFQRGYLLEDVGGTYDVPIRALCPLTWALKSIWNCWTTTWPLSSRWPLPQA